MDEQRNLFQTCSAEACYRLDFQAQQHGGPHLEVDHGGSGAGRADDAIDAGSSFMFPTTDASSLGEEDVSDSEC